jgi:hypothetical protein
MMTSALMPSQSRTKRYVTAAVRVTGVRAAAGRQGGSQANLAPHPGADNRPERQGNR